VLRKLPGSVPPATVATIVATLVTVGCLAVPSPKSPAIPPVNRRGLPVAGPFLAFHGRADQMGDLAAAAARFRVIAVDADPANRKFTPADLAVLRAGGRNVLLGFLNIGYCDREQIYWRSAPDGILPCVANMPAQISERSGRPQQIWMDLEDQEYQRLIGEYEAPRLAELGVDGFLLNGLDLLDHGPDDDEAPCDQDCLEGGLTLLKALRLEFPTLIFIMQGGLSPNVRGNGLLGQIRTVQLFDGIVGEQVYTPTYDPAKEAELATWKRLGTKLVGPSFAAFTQDYVGACADVNWARSVHRASAAHGFSPAVGLSPVSRGRLCNWPDL